MTRRFGRAACAALLLTGLLAQGCSVLREIPRTEYAAVAERKNVRLVTRDSLEYELDFIRIEGDTLVGFRRRDEQGPIEEFGTVRVPLDDVTSLSTRSTDWLRTGLLGGAAVVGLAVGGLASRGSEGDTSTIGKPPGGGLP